MVCLVGKLDEVYAMLADANPNMVAYRKDDIPEHFHYQHNVRIMPILLEAKEGWTIMQNRTGLFMRTSENPAWLFWTFFFFFKQQAFACSNYSFTGDVFLSPIQKLVQVIPNVINEEGPDSFSHGTGKNRAVGVGVL